MAINRQKLTLFLLLAGIAMLMFVLAASLNQVDLQPGQPLKIPSQSLPEQSTGELPGTHSVLILAFRGFLAISVILTPIILLVMLFSKQGRSQLAKLLVSLLIVMMLLALLNRIAPTEAPDPVDEALSTTELAEEGTGLDSTVFVDEPPDWTTWVASLAIALFLAGISIGLMRLFIRHREPATALDRLAEEAQDALDRLELGEDLRETILRCYREMMLVVKETRGIVREQYVTPHEFESLLERHGLPAESLLRLTHLFEEARYGGQLTGRQDEQLAILCLQDIVAACQEGKTYEA
ncbi:MAG: DUF4129 domain-containing protein [Anaerolineae bacterium]|nr:DUF4129 domain-containing protein [Anaerolineae bacterium]